MATTTSSTELLDQDTAVGTHQPLESYPSSAGRADIRIPSERAFHERKRRRVEGLVYDRAIVEVLHTLATPSKTFHEPVGSPCQIIKIAMAL